MTEGHQCDNCRKFIRYVTMELCSECSRKLIACQEKEDKEKK